MSLIFLELLGGLGLFIAGMNMMSRGIEKVAGNKLRGFLERCTRTRFLGVIVGLVFTAIIQSSSASTVMVVSFVNSGLMTLAEACGIILGANIGTTVTALLVAFKLSTIAPLFVFLGAVMVNFIKKPIIRKSGEVVLGFGILFMGISGMSSAMATLRDVPGVMDILTQFTNPFLGVLLGLVITSIVQSSSVTVSILVVMAAQGLVDLPICMFVILGCNLGSCSTALMSAFGGSKNAMRAAMIHFLFNLFGTTLMFGLLMGFGDFIAELIYTISGHGTDSANMGRNIAVAHFLFKSFQVIVFYPFMDYIIALTYKLVPGEEEKENENKFYLEHIKEQLPNPSVAVYVAVQEMERMANMAISNLNLAIDCLASDDEEKSKQVFENEKYINYLDEQISNYLVKINENTLPIGDAHMISAYFHVVSDIERIGDHAEDIAELIPELYHNGIKFSQNSITELQEMMKLVNQILEEALDAFVTGNTKNREDIHKLEDEIDRMERELQAAHIKRLGKGSCSPQAGVYFSDIVSSLERIGDHATNIAFSLMEAKQHVEA